MKYLQIIDPHNSQNVYDVSMLLVTILILRIVKFSLFVQKK
jgi:hypothetical protein